MEKNIKDKIIILSKFEELFVKKIKRIFSYQDNLNVKIVQLVNLSDEDYVHLKVSVNSKHLFMREYHNAKIVKETTQYIKYNKYEETIIFSVCKKFDKVKELVENYLLA